MQTNNTEMVINKILAQVDDLPAEILQRVQKAARKELYQYELIPKSKEMVLYTGAPELLKCFLASKKTEGAADTTIKTYYQTLTKYLARLQKDPLKVTTMEIRMYLALRESEGLNKNSVSSLLSILKSFYTWIEDENLITKSPCRPIKPIKTNKYIRKPLNHEEFENMRIASRTPKERAILEFLYSTGARLDEVCKLDISDIRWKDDCCLVWGKGSKEREVYIDAKARVYVQRYLNSRKDNNAALFVCDRAPHNRLGRRSIEKAISDIGKRAKLTRPVYPHLLRHTRATDLLNSGVSITAVQKMLGHESPATTQIYAQLNAQQIKSEILKGAA